MDDLAKEYVISFFDRNLQFHGDRPEAVRWTSEGQLLHYQSLLDIGDFREKKILDFGCGKGDFHQFLKDREIRADYTGVDINERLISLAQQKYPECSFRIFDIERDELKEDFDYIFLCGVFNLRVEGLEGTIERTLSRLFRHCRAGLAFNALSAHDPKKNFELNYLYPEEIFRFAVGNLSPYVSLRQDRMPYDFTMFVYKEAVK